MQVLVIMHRALLMLVKNYKYEVLFFIPNTSPRQKIEQVRMFGGKFVRVEITGDTFDDAYASAAAHCEKHKMTFIHPFNDLKVVQGQATVAPEILEDTKEDIDYLFVPIGGGGLISGVGSYFKQISPQTKIIGVEPAGALSMKNP